MPQLCPGDLGTLISVPAGPCATFCLIVSQQCHPSPSTSSSQQSCCFPGLSRTQTVARQRSATGLCVQRTRHGWLVLSMGDYGTIGVRAQGSEHMKGGYVSRQSHTDSTEPPQGRLRRVCTFSHFQMGKLRMRVAEIVQVAAIWLASLSNALWMEGSDFLPSLSPKHPQLSFVSLLFPLFPWFLLVCTVRFGPGNCMVGLHSGGPWGLQSHCPWRT